MERDGTIRFANDAWERFCRDNDVPGGGRHRDGNLLMAIQEHARGADAAWTGLLEDLRSLASLQKPDFRRECPGRDAAGPQWFEVTGKPLPRMPVQQFVVCCLVITHQVAARDEALRNERRLRLLLAASKAGTWDWDIRSGKTVWSPENYELYGVSRDHPGPTYEQWQNTLHPDDRSRTSQALMRAVEDENARFNEVFRILHPALGLRWLVGIAWVEREQGQAVRMIGINLDITLTKEAEDRIRIEKGAFQRLAENSPDIIARFDAAGRHLYVNPSATAVTGRLPAEFIGRTNRELGMPEHLCQHWERVIKSVFSGVARSYEFSFPMAGGERHFAAVCVPESDERGRIISALCISRDITDLRQAAEALQRAEQRKSEDLNRLVEERTADLREVVAELERFSYSLSHDLRAPLRSMEMYAQILLEDFASLLPGPGRAYLERIQKGAHRLDVLIREVLAYSQISKAHIPLERVELDELVEEVLSMRPALRAVKFVVGRPLPCVLGHSGYLTQCISNLVDNAVKFCPPERNPEIRIHASEDGSGTVRVVVEDNGIGIAAEHQDRIFTLFGRVHPDSHYEGTGIGLAIVKRAVERMGGAVGVDSTPGVGSRFWIRIPAPVNSPRPGTTAPD